MTVCVRPWWGRRPQPYFLWRWGATTEVAAFDPLFRLKDLRKSGHPVILVVKAAEPVPRAKPAERAYRPASEGGREIVRGHR